MAERDYYDILGIKKTANAQQIKKAYRQLALKYHPDRNPDNKQAEERLKEANKAYEVLSDSQKKQAYDQFGHAGVDPNRAGGFGSQGHDFGDVFGDMFGDMFGDARRRGRGRGHHQPARGDDLSCTVELTLEEAVRGESKTIKIPTLVHCEQCNGSGARKGSKPTNCSSCQGAGQIQMRQGFFTVQQTCPTCGGKGKVISNPCVKCRGRGRYQHNKTLNAKIPAGVDIGDRVRLPGEGNSGEAGSTPGDLYIQIKIKTHSIFTREGDNLFCEVPISFLVAALGGELEVPTLNGRVKLKINPETQTGKMFRIRGKGVKSVRSSHVGDLLCRVTVETPVKLTEQQKQLLKEFDAACCANSDNKHKPKEKGFFEGVKKFFDDLRS